MLRLVDLDVPLLDAALADPPQLASRLEARDVPGALIESAALEFSRAELSRRPEILGFWTCAFLLEEGGERLFAGIGGYEGPPDAQGREKNGFRRAGEAHDGDAGRVFRWELDRP